jgi:hypothetical protein
MRNETAWQDIIMKWTFILKEDLRLVTVRWKEVVTGPHSAKLFRKHFGIELADYSRDTSAQFALITKESKAKVELIMGSSNYYAIIKMIEARDIEHGKNRTGQGRKGLGKLA